MKGVEGVVSTIAWSANAIRPGFPKVRSSAANAKGTTSQQSWAQAQAGTLTIPGVALRGEAGIGKSRLASAAAT